MENSENKSEEALTEQEEGMPVPQENQESQAEALQQPESEENTDPADLRETFRQFGFCPELQKAIDEAGFVEPTPIQAQAIPVILEGRDVIGQALTGTGKTAAFGLPVLQKMLGQDALNFLVLVPTRELAAQVSAELYRFARYMQLHTAAFTGGQSYTRQEKLLKSGIQALVATPGRLLDLMNSGHFVDVNPAYIVVDEADEMLDMGFIEDIRKIFEAFSGPHQTMLFSATMPRPVLELAEQILKEPVKLTIDVKETANNNIQQFFFVIEEHERIDAIVRLIDAQNVEKAMIFCRTKEETDALNILLGGRGYHVNCLHGDMEQAQRTRVMNAFRRGEIDILVATDVAARGLDVDDVTHVFNFHLPFDPRGYVHRIGRTGRAGRAGTAITLVTPREMRQLNAIRRTVGAQIENRLIPSRTEATSLRLKKLFRDILDRNLDMDVFQQVQTLSVNQDVMVLLAKLAAYSLSGGADQGPEHIGIAGQRLDQILAPKRKRRGRGDREQEAGEFPRDTYGHGRRRTRREPAPPQLDLPGDDIKEDQRGNRSNQTEQPIASSLPERMPASKAERCSGEEELLALPSGRKLRIPRPPVFEDSLDAEEREPGHKPAKSGKHEKKSRKEFHRASAFGGRFHGESRPEHSEKRFSGKKHRGEEGFSGGRKNGFRKSSEENSHSSKGKKRGGRREEPGAYSRGNSHWYRD